VAGAILARTPGAWPAVARLRLPSLLITLTAWLLLLSLPDAPIALLRTAYAAQQWAGVMAALGFGWVHLRQPAAWQRQLVHRIFAVYVLHQTLIVLLAVALRPLALQPLTEWPLLLGGTLVGAWALVRACEPIKPLRRWLGLPAA